MHVQISYTVDFEEVPGQILKLLEGVESTVSAVNSQYKKIVDNLDSKQEGLGDILPQIKAFRDILVGIDLRLVDCELIARGYQRALLEGEEVLDPQSPQPTQPTINTEKADDPPGVAGTKADEAMLKKMTEKTEKKMQELKNTFDQYSTAFDTAPRPAGKNNEVASMMSGLMSGMTPGMSAGQTNDTLEKIAELQKKVNKNLKKE